MFHLGLEVFRLSQFYNTDYFISQFVVFDGISHGKSLLSVRDKELDVRSDPGFISAMETYCLFGEECVQPHLTAL